MVTNGSFMCAYCGQANDSEVDPSGGLRQEYEEDCQVCCRPNFLVVEFSQSRDTVTIDAQPENG
jgi:hypothetical protein